MSPDVVEASASPEISPQQPEGSPEISPEPVEEEAPVAETQAIRMFGANSGVKSESFDDLECKDDALDEEDLVGDGFFDNM